MKFILLTLCFISFGILAQNYVPFNDTVPKRFFNVADISEDDYFFYSMSSSIFGDSVMFDQYIKAGNSFISSPNCPSWGGGGLSGDTTWLGRQIIFDMNLQTLSLKNRLGEDLYFDFNLALGDSALFYQNVSNDFYIYYAQNTQETVLGQSEWVKTFIIKHYDNAGQVINSELHTFEIKLGETLGMIQFINCDVFPASEIGVSIMGQLYPALGVYQMTYDEAFPWQIDDSLQYSRYYASNQGAGFPVTRIYDMIWVTNRIETIDSVWIYWDQDSWIQSSGASYSGPFLFEYSNPIVFAKEQNILEVPHNIIAIDSFNHYLDSVSTCNVIQGELSYVEGFNYYCDSCECMVPYDGFMTFIETKKYQSNKGITYQHYQEYGPLDQTSSSGKTLVYSKINGVVCGTPTFLGIDELSLRIGVFPNPTSELIQLTFTFSANNIQISDVNGIIVYNEKIDGTEIQVNVEGLEPGVYFIHASGNEYMASGRFIVN